MQTEPPLYGEETLSDPAYLKLSNTRISSEPLPYDKAMMERWFQARVVEHRPPHG